jgi:transposase-like protein
LRCERENAFVAGRQRPKTEPPRRHFRQQQGEKRRHEWHAEAVAADLDGLLESGIT